MEENDDESDGLARLTALGILNEDTRCANAIIRRKESSINVLVGYEKKEELLGQVKLEV